LTFYLFSPTLFLKIFLRRSVMANPNAAACPVCEADIQLADNTVLAELIICDACSSPLEVRGVDPVVLVEAPQEEEDWGE
jgi:alpha-aminoadipate carrier protein LysW